MTLAGLVHEATRPSNKGMKLTSVERIGRSQLIPGVRRTRKDCEMEQRDAAAATFVGIAIAGVVACGRGGDNVAPCLPTPCPVTVALTLTVTSAHGGPVDGVLIKVTGAPAGTPQCTSSDDATRCSIAGSGGTYTVEINAPGYQSATRTVVVQQSGGTAPCTCSTVVTTHADVVLTPT